jgi:stringent starvation protein B
MLSIRPYLLDAYYNWIIDSGMTPYIIVNINAAGVRAPKEYAFNNELTLDISPSVVDNLVLTPQALTCSAFFDSGQWDLRLPLKSIISIFAFENDQGITFLEEEGDDDSNAVIEDSSAAQQNSAPGFRLIKND